MPARPRKRLEFDEVLVVRSDLSDPAFERPVSVEVVEDLVGVDPGAVHPQVADLEVLEDRNEFAGVIVVGVR